MLHLGHKRKFPFRRNSINERLLSLGGYGCFSPINPTPPPPSVLGALLT